MLQWIYDLALSIIRYRGLQGSSFVINLLIVHVVPTFPDSPAYNVRRIQYTPNGANLYDILEPVIQDILGIV